MDTSIFEKQIGLNFHNKDLLKQAFIHRSYVNENADSGIWHNERLEFLGDAVLELVVTDHLYKKFPNKPEGELTALRSALVNTQTLSEVANELKMNDFLLLSKGESKDKNTRARQFILADTVEALIGAVYLDQGYDKAQSLIESKILNRLEKIIAEELFRDPKSKVQEIAQEKIGLTPSYRILEEKGPDHDKHFIAGIFFGDQLISKGHGQSKQEAQTQAAFNALEEKGWK